MLILSACDGLIQGQVDFIGRVYGSVGHLGHGLAKGLEVIVLGLVHQNVTVCQKQDPFLLLGLPEPPYDLKGSICLAGARCHHEQDAILTFSDGLYCAVYGHRLVITGAASAAGIVIGLLNGLPCFWLLEASVLAVQVP